MTGTFRHTLLGVIALGAAFLHSCDKLDNPVIEVVQTIDTTDIEVPEFSPLTSAVPRVLIEDFTAHQCVNCPPAGLELASLMDAHPDSIVQRRVTFKEALSGDIAKRCCAVSHRWETSKEPDTQNVQLEALREFLLSPQGQHIEEVWYDYTCMPQGDKRTPEEKAEFTVMLRNINMLYLGATVLILLDMAYLSRTCTRIKPPRAALL